jgi:phosphoserine phosphatase
MYANELEIINGKLTGNYLGEIVDGKKKARPYKLLQTGRYSPPPLRKPP